MATALSPNDAGLYVEGAVHTVVASSLNQAMHKVIASFMTSKTFSTCCRDYC